MNSDGIAPPQVNGDQTVSAAPVDARLAGLKGLHLALGGGAARGLAHVGVLKALQTHQVPIASICGTSIGALIGAVFALNPDAQFVERYVRDFLQSDAFHRARFSFIKAAHEARKKEGLFSFRYLFHHGVLLRRTMAHGSMIPFDEFQDQVAQLVPDKKFADTKIPFFVLSVDLSHRKEVVFDSGALRSAVMASSAIPGVFPSIRSNGTVYVDGGWMNKVPVRPLLAMGGKCVLGIDVADDPPPEIHPRRGLSLVFQAYAASSYRLQQLQNDPRALMWRPQIRDRHWSDFTQMETAVSIGEECATARIAEVWDMLENAAKRPTLRRRFVRWICSRGANQQQCIPFELREIHGIDAVDFG